MLRRIKVPNLFLIVGQPDNGKTTISNWFEKMLGCEVIHTDQLYHAWIEKNYPKQYKAAKANIRGHYGTMSSDWQKEWLEYATDYIIEAVKRAKLDLVVEGWLMLYLTDELRAKIEQYATIMRIHMRHYVAHAADKQIRPEGRDYTKSVKSLCSLMARSKGVSFMRRLVNYQSFEDIRDFQGVSDSCGKMLALNLPTDMTGKTVLDVGCSTGYFTIRCYQRGAKAYGIDKLRKNAKTAARLASAVYRTTEPRFYHCNFFKWTKKQQYDYILAVNLLSTLGDDTQAFFDRAFELLKPGGTLVVEAAVSCVRATHPKHNEPYIEVKEYAGKQFQYPNERALAILARKYKLTYRGRSVRMHGDKRRRVYHFTKPEVTE
jgi:2-polyprenyl-3-methyl-5-hydroxy-6-metoxy-1,4-benzoquinol methylase